MQKLNLTKNEKIVLVSILFWSFISISNYLSYSVIESKQVG
jgi:hypothetical protein